jgi:hypothetical protein
LSCCPIYGVHFCTAYNIGNGSGFSVQEAIDAAVKRFESNQADFIASSCRENTLQFSPEVFREQFSTLVAEEYESFMRGK